MKLKDFISKARSAGLNPANVVAWASLKFLDWQGALTGTSRLRAKAWALGVELGANVTAHGPVCLMRWPGGRIRIGSDVSIISSWRRATAATLGSPTRLRVFGKGAFIDIGKGCQLNGASITARSRTIILGENVMLAPNCVIVDSDFHAPWPASARQTNPGYENDAPVSVDANAWIGMNSIILKGVTIGEGAMIGAGSVVTRDIPANALACGVPARVVKLR